jgi:hypothetical protein
LTDFEIDTTYKRKTLKKQERRRIRAENRLFRTNTDNAITSITKKLFVARRHNHLFTPKQVITKPIHHLRYKNRMYDYPVASNYPYRVPFDYFLEYNKTHPRTNQQKLPYTSNILTDTISKDTIIELMMPVDTDGRIEPSPSSSSNVNVPPSSSKSRSYKVKDIENWIALPPEVERKLLKVYLPFVPNKPLYSRSKKRYYSPGTPKWYEHVKEAHRLNQIRKSTEKRKHKLQADAVYYGTTPSKLKKRKRNTTHLTQYQNRIHNVYLKKGKNKDNQSNLVYKRPQPGSDSEVTSDNTKDVEYRPLK